MKIVFVVGTFPAISETFIINQIADLLERGIEVEIFSFQRGKKENISQRFFDHKMESKTSYLSMPANFFWRLFFAIPKIIKILLRNPGGLLRALNFLKYGRNAYSLKLIFWVEPFLNKKFDLCHCHFGPIANKFLFIKDILRLDAKIITSFLGYDVSSVFKKKGASVYDRLKKESSAFIVMSNNMKERIMVHGFEEKKIKVLPISINVKSYPFKKRFVQPGEVAQLVSVGRFVEKKGFDDLLKALVIVKEKTNQKFCCNIIGGGQLEQKLFALTEELKLQDVVHYKGYMQIEEIIKYFLDNHLYLQPSKTASDGDME